uniref:Uncharacterized protein n=1 Tax=Magallana gigas TaxID=29159 RepID=K1QLY2_MAGGI
MTLVIVTYLIANVAYLGVLSPGEMLQSPAVAVIIPGKRTILPSSSDLAQPQTYRNVILTPLIDPMF